MNSNTTNKEREKEIPKSLLLSSEDLALVITPQCISKLEKERRVSSIAFFVLVRASYEKK